MLGSLSFQFKEAFVTLGLVSVEKMNPKMLLEIFIFHLSEKVIKLWVYFFLKKNKKKFFVLVSLFMLTCTFYPLRNLFLDVHTHRTKALTSVSK